MWCGKKSIRLNTGYITYNESTKMFTVLPTRMPSWQLLCITRPCVPIVHVRVFYMVMMNIWAWIFVCVAGSALTLWHRCCRWCRLWAVMTSRSVQFLCECFDTWNSRNLNACWLSYIISLLFWNSKSEHFDSTYLA